MKIGVIWFTTVALLLASSGQAQKSSTKEALESIIQTEEIATFFDGIFNHLGITIAETGEELTLHHEGNIVRIEEGMNPDEVDFILPLQLENIGNLIDFTNDGEFTDYEATRIARVFFTPFTRVTLQSEVMSANNKRRAAGIEDLIHVKLLYPDGTLAASHTLIYAAEQWLVIEGLEGNPKRMFTLTQGPALNYQRKIFDAMQTDTRKGWMKFLKWYKSWRKEFSVSHS